MYKNTDVLFLLIHWLLTVHIYEFKNDFFFTSKKKREKVIYF